MSPILSCDDPNSSSSTRSEAGAEAAQECEWAGARELGKGAIICAEWPNAGPGNLILTFIPGSDSAAHWRVMLILRSAY